MELSKYIDHTMLKSSATSKDIIGLCEEAIKYNFMSVCVNPCFVKLASEKLKDSNVKVCTVIGFPLGATSTASKVFEASHAILDGASEIDMVINIGAMIEGDYEYVEREIKIIREKTKGYILKVIIETCYLTDEQKEKVCKICMNSQVDFVKTSTGFGSGGATTYDVELIKKVVGDNCLIKASGGVKTREDALIFINKGANRIGTSNGITIMQE